jgi:DNA-binding LacI/PurR family transcriptional regulator
MQMIGHIEEYLRQRGYCTIIMGAGGDLAKTVDSLLFQNVAGMLIYPELSKPDLDKFHTLRSMDFPFVVMSSDGKDYGLDAVFMDRRAGVYKATVHLISLGHKHIAYICSGDAAKLKGYKQALDEHKIPFDQGLVNTRHRNTCQGGYDACAELLSQNQKLSALFCATDIFALGAAKCCRDRGLVIPADMAIVGYDNLEAGAFAAVPLTTIAYNIQKETEMAVELLFRRMNEGAGVKNENIALEPELIIRESTGGMEVL